MNGAAGPNGWRSGDAASGNGERVSRDVHPARGLNGNRLAAWPANGGHVGPPFRVLAVGAHPDDIELGCGGTLIAHRMRGDEVALLVMSKGERGPQDVSSRISEQQEAARILGADLFWGDFEDADIPGSRETVDVIQDVMRCVRPDVVYTHTTNDSHQDHRAIALATLAATRRFCRVLQYEAPSSLRFAPTLFVDIASGLEAKLDALRAHTSQVLRNGLVDLEAVEAQARYRGFQARVRLAEAFEAERFVWDLSRRPSTDGGVPKIQGLVLEEVNGC